MSLIPEGPLLESGMIVAAGSTAQGSVREENQDRLATVGAANGDVVLIVADGMGGQAGGGDAAEATVRAVTPVLAAAGEPRALLTAAASAADDAVATVRERIGGQPGTTLVMAWISPHRAILANLGDSRGYHLRDGSAVPVTADHSWVAEQIRAGALPESAARSDGRRNIVTRAVLGDGATADVTEVELCPGDLILLCSDGVWEPLSDEAIAATVVGDGPLSQRVARLVQAALDGGSHDNATVVAAQISR